MLRDVRLGREMKTNLEAKLNKLSRKFFIHCYDCPKCNILGADAKPCPEAAKISESLQKIRLALYRAKHGATR